VAIASQTFTLNVNDQTNTETYDANGNLLTSGDNTYAWDFGNRLKLVNSGAVTMVYDGDGNRATKTVGSSTTQIPSRRSERNRHRVRLAESRHRLRTIYRSVGRFYPAGGKFGTQPGFQWLWNSVPTGHGERGAAHTEIIRPDSTWRRGVYEIGSNHDLRALRRVIALRSRVDLRLARSTKSKSNLCSDSVRIPFAALR